VHKRLGFIGKQDFRSTQSKTELFSQKTSFRNTKSEWHFRNGFSRILEILCFFVISVDELLLELMTFDDESQMQKTFVMLFVNRYLCFYIMK